MDHDHCSRSINCNNFQRIKSPQVEFRAQFSIGSDHFSNSYFRTKEMKRFIFIVAILIISSVHFAYSCDEPEPEPEVCEIPEPEPEDCQIPEPLPEPDPQPETEVCGSDGQTYEDDSDLQCQQQQNPCLRKVKDEACGDCVCTLEYDPVCGSDCQTYGNPCSFECQKEVDLFLFQLHYGECADDCVPTPPPECSCPAGDCNAVCGSNGRTYDNECELECAQTIETCLTKVSDGVCGECVCTLEYDPVCGSDGTTYGNPCEFECAQDQDPSLELVCEDPCEECNASQCEIGD